MKFTKSSSFPPISSFIHKFYKISYKYSNNLLRTSSDASAKIVIKLAFKTLLASAAPINFIISFRTATPYLLTI